MADPLDSLPPKVAEALRRGDKIGAIKLLREVARVGLAEAKTAIDAANRSSQVRKPAAAAPSSHTPHSPPHQTRAVSPLYSPGLSPGEVPRRSSGIGFVFLLIVAAIAIGLFWKLA